MPPGSYFTTLGVGAFTGRVFTAADDRAAAEPVAVMLYNAWQNLYGGDPSVVGSTLMIEGHAFTVSGIAPPGFFGETLRADPPDLWLPLQHEPLISGADTSLLRQPMSAWLRVIGRLRADATIDGMGARLTVILRQWMRQDAGYPANWIRPHSGSVMRSAGRPAVASSQAITEFEFHISPAWSSSRPQTGRGTAATWSSSRRATFGSPVSRRAPPAA